LPASSPTAAVQPVAASGAEPAPHRPARPRSRPTGAVEAPTPPVVEAASADETALVRGFVERFERLLAECDEWRQRALQAEERTASVEKLLRSAERRAETAETRLAAAQERLRTWNELTRRMQQLSRQADSPARNRPSRAKRDE
jgi:hypothetical protein